MTLQQLYAYCENIQRDSTLVVFDTYVEYMLDSAPVFCETFDEMPWELATADVRRFRIEGDTLYVWVEVDE